MRIRPKPITILLADDDADDRLLAEEALHEARVANDVRFVKDGVELLDYLYRRGRYREPSASPTPGLILLDLNMPRLDGRGALTAIKSDERLRSIPVVILTTSQAEQDICRSYDLGASSFVTKPVTFEGIVCVMKAIHHYWFEIVELPTRPT